MREPGYYWIKCCENSDWCVAEYIKGVFIINTECYPVPKYKEEEIFEIGNKIEYYMD